MAKKLHNGDEVADKKTGEVFRVIKTTVVGLVRPTVFVEVVDASGSWQEFMHTELKG
jgi:hypothetical protein